MNVYATLAPLVRSEMLSEKGGKRLTLFWWLVVDKFLTTVYAKREQQSSEVQLSKSCLKNMDLATQVGTVSRFLTSLGCTSATSAFTSGRFVVTLQ